MKDCPLMADHANVLDSLLLPSASADLKELLAQYGARLQHADGVIAVSFRGELDLDGVTVPYDVVSDQGMVAKRGRWQKSNSAQRLALVQEVVTPELAHESRASLQEGVLEAKALAHRMGVSLDARMLSALVAPGMRASVRLQVVRDRIEAAAIRVRETGMAEKTRSAVTLAEYPASFAVAQSMQRKFIALLGEPNSGKTHDALVHLEQAESGVYLAPLRLLALENFERLEQRGVPVSMVTGEECRLREGATHVASTIEMLNFQRRVQVAVIDEVQMLSDSERGAAWTAAICGAPADTVYLIGSLTARAAIESLAQRLGCELEVREKSRKSPLSVEKQSVRAVTNLKAGDAVIAFSRREVLYWRDTLTSAGFSVATIYGNLSPEVRRAQAALFREGKVDILVGTDALGMGLNLPISRVVFSTAVKFDGESDALLPAWLAQQIGGRAGRYGITAHGYVAGFDTATHRQVEALMKEPLEPILSHGFYVAPTVEHLKQIRGATGEERLAVLLEQFARHIDTHDEFFLPANLAEPLERAKWLDNLSLALEDRFLLSLVPLSTKVGWLAENLEAWALAWSKGRASRLPSVEAVQGPQSLQRAEDACKLYSAYAWLGYRRPEFFPDGELAVTRMREVSEKIDEALRKQNSQRSSSPRPTRTRPGEPRQGRPRADDSRPAGVAKVTQRPGRARGRTA